MRNGGSGLRFVGWGVLIVAVVAVAAAVIGYQLKLVGDQRTYIDVNSGDLLSSRTVMGFTLSQTITQTDFSKLVRAAGLSKPDPDWRQILQFSWLSGANSSFPLHGADTACQGAVWKLRNETSDDVKRQLLDSYLKLLKAGDVKGMSNLSATIGTAQEKRLGNGSGNTGDTNP
jgi:hypothetical protein